MLFIISCIEVVIVYFQESEIGTPYTVKGFFSDPDIETHLLKSTVLAD